MVEIGEFLRVILLAGAVSWRLEIKNRLETVVTHFTADDMSILATPIFGVHRQIVEMCNIHLLILCAVYVGTRSAAQGHATHNVQYITKVFHHSMSAQILFLCALYRLPFVEV